MATHGRTIDMDRYIEIAAQHGLHGAEALKFASERMDKDVEREERRREREEREKEREREREEREREREREREKCEKEREEREKEREEREKERKHELEKLQHQSETLSTSRQTANPVLTPKLPPFAEGRDEMDSYLLRFEKFAQAAGWDEGQWAVSLSALLTGKALDIYYRMDTDESSDYSCLKQALLKRYGLTAEGYRRRLRESKPDQDETPDQFVVRLQSYLKQWIEMSEAEDSRSGLKDLIIREQFMNICPADLRIFLSERRMATLHELVETAQQFLEARGLTLCELNQKHKWSRETKQRSSNNGEKISAPSSASALQVNARASQAKCAFCEEHHNTVDCRQVSKLSAEERRRRLLASGCCFLCLQPRHIASTCDSKKTCSSCKRRHHELLCLDSQPKVSSTAQFSNTAQILAARSQVKNKTGVALQTAYVVASGPAGSERAKMLLDSGSNQSFITRRLATTLGCKQTGEQDTNILSFGGVEKHHNSMKKVAVTLKKTEDGPGNLTLNMAQIDTICGPVNSNLTLSEEEMEHLRDLDLADPPEQWSENRDIDLLIGMDFYQDIVTGHVRRSASGPIAMESIFGWIIGGRIGSAEEENQHAMFIQTVESGEDLNRIWDLETIGIESPPFTSACEEKQIMEKAAEDHFECNCNRLDDGRYEVRWPKKDNFDSLPQDDRLARARLERCEKALESSGQREKYERALMQYVEDGYAERAPDTPDGQVHVMSHHAVYKNGKIRIVFDASAGDPVSLNDCVLTGPNLISDLAGILLRFRLNAVAVSADIEKAFLQISLHPEERDVTRFLWRETPGAEPSVFRMTRVVFGVNASPFLLQATIKRHLNQYGDTNVMTAKRLSTDLYCDDLLTSLKTEDEADSFIKETKQIFCDAKMNMRKWASNKQLAAIEDAEPDTVLLADGEVGEQKVLGVVWSPADDSLRYHPDHLMKLSENLRPTKRNILKISARIFDPLGLLTPFTVRTKMLLKQMWMEGTGWDDPVSDDVQKRWLAWTDELKHLDQIRVPRTYDSESMDRFELHTFCDASQEAYAAAVYIRPAGGPPRRSTLMMSKSRLAPTKTMCLARLELMAAVVGARLTDYVVSSLNMQPESIYMWTDSAVALAWIRSNPKRWGTFVANRVTEVQQKVPPECWRHCPGQSNPADLPSRGASVRKLQEDFWQKGPDWLELPEAEWPQQFRISEPPECQAEERKKKSTVTPVLMSSVQTPSDESGQLRYIIDVNRYSSLNKLHRVTAWVLKWNSIRTGETEGTGCLTTEEIERAEHLWLRELQKETYGDELGMLEAGEEINRQSDIYKLTPFLEQGLLKVTGRLQEAELTEEEKHPIIISGEHKYAQLLIQNHHQRSCHGGVQQTLHSLRERFWIPKGRQVVRKVIRDCPVCKTFSTQPFDEDAAPLPKERVTQRPPFSAIGVDLAGPLYRRGTSGQSPLKAWIVLFTCTVVRAVHLELVESQSAEDLMKAFDRFTARRGEPQLIFSDNGLNFKRASEILLSRGIKWRFNVPRAPWWGGFWERLIRMTKEALRKTLGRSFLTWEELDTTLCRIEAAINARPLTALNDDPNDLRPLSPNDFLLQRPTSAETGYQNDHLSSISSSDLRSMRNHRKQVLQHLWKRWKVEYLKELRLPSRPGGQSRGPREHDLVLIEDNPRSSRVMWRTGIIEELHPGRDGRVRAATVRTTDGVLVRPIQRLHLLEGTA